VLDREVSKPFLYLHYLEALDTQDQKVIKLLGELEVISVEISNLLLFVSQAWKEIGAKKLLEWAESTELSEHRNSIIQTAESVKRILTEREEYVLNIKSRPLSLANTLHDELTGSFEFEIERDGTIQVLTDAEIRALRESPDREIRRKAFESIRKVYG
jgi:oligoendopeptidase F